MSTINLRPKDAPIAFRGEGLAKVRELMGVYGLALTVPGLPSAGQDESGE